MSRGQTQKEFINFAKQAESQIINGVEVIKYGFDYAYNWLDENACRIGLTAAISMGFVAAFSPSNPQGATTSASISAMVIAAIESAGRAAKKTAVNTALAYSVALVVIEPIWMIPGIHGACDKTMLTNCISNAIYYSFDVSMEMWMSGAGVCIALGAAVAPIIATYICTRTMPNGFSKAITDPHNNVNSFDTLTKSIKDSEMCYDNLPAGWSKSSDKMYGTNMPPAGYKWVYGPNGQRDKAKIRQSQRRKEFNEWFKNLKSNLECTKCGFSHPAALDFHHTNPELKEGDITKLKRFANKVVTIPPKLLSKNPQKNTDAKLSPIYNLLKSEKLAENKNETLNLNEKKVEDIMVGIDKIFMIFVKDR